MIIAGAILFAFLQSDEGQWLMGLIIVYGGVMLGGAVAHQTVPGEVVDLNRIDPPNSYSAGSISFTYRDDEGVLHEERRRVMYATDKFRALAVGDEIKVWVCRNDRSRVKLVGYGTSEPQKCFDEPEQ
ncbi:hypothetical protein [Croceicoccus gelatinilyticus]|uniref:hypothetical protein n=1 Tax=Croceicoccus gelatinilyticus TaxID=2835536 RepID=UPI001BCEB9A0|nr:hypothetical protein [Croceicoccus gelatinilyticus]MBS7670229.1 hypothetical protein [Croceicoccus gelatinilyticus]